MWATRMGGEVRLWYPSAMSSERRGIESGFATAGSKDGARRGQDSLIASFSNPVVTQP